MRTRALVLSLGVLVLGCGYALVGRGTNIPEDVRRVYLKPLENQTQRSEVEQFLTQAIADELVTRQRFTLVASQEEADAILQGAVLTFLVTPVTFDDQGRAQEYEITITAQMSFARPESEGTLWANDRYLFKENYAIESSEVAFFDRENLAIEETSMRFAETMVTDLLEGF